MNSTPSIAHTTRQLQWLSFDPKHLLVPVLLSFWVMCFISFSAPEDWRTTRFGTVSILPKFVLTAMKLLGRGGTLAMILFCLLSVWKHQKRPHVIATMAPLLIFGMYGVLSTVWSGLKSVSLQQSVTFMIVPLLATYIGIIWRSDRDTERIVKHLVLAIFALSIVLIALRFGMPRSGALTKDSSGVLHSTAACASGGLCILLVIAARVLWRSVWTLWCFPIVAIEVGMMLIAGNRLSVVVTAVAVILLLAIAMHRGYAALFVLVGSVFIATYFVCDPSLTVVQSVGKEVGVFAKQGQSKSQLNSVSGRTEMWDKMIKSFLKSPVIGHGFFVSTEKGRIYVWDEWGNWTAHNVILQILVTLGVVGLTILLLGLGFLVSGVFAGIKCLDEVNKSLILLLVVSVWYLGWGTLNESFMGPLLPEVVVFAGLVGVAAGIAAAARWEAALESAETSERRTSIE